MNWTIEGFFWPDISTAELANGAVTVFAANLIGNTINFQGPFVKALITAIVFLVAFSGQ